MQATAVFDSSGHAGWRSVQLHRVVNDRVAERRELPARSEHTLVLTTRGRAVVESRQDGGRWHRCDYGPGRLGMTAPGRPVTLRWRTSSAEHKETLHLYLPGRMLVGLAADLWHRDVAPEELPDTLGTHDRVVETTMLAMADAAAAGADDLYAESAAMFLAVHLLSQAGRENERIGPDDPRLRRAVDFMHENLGLPITLADIGAAAGLSTFHFVRMFRSAIGEPPRRYLTRLRIEAACRLLAGGRAPITEIAFRCGFSSSAHLSAALRRHIGMSPTQYRRTMA
nr:AraC family transcriptional regulator [uncultured Actinoplanes sp.]